MLDNLLDTILCGDSTFLMKSIPDDSIDLVITSPPYFQQRDYLGSHFTCGCEREINEYLESLMDIFEEALRITKPTGNIVYNIGDKYLDKSLQLIPFRFAIKAIDEHRTRLVNNITWIKSNPTPRQFDRRLVNASEPFFHFVKSDEYYYDKNEFLKNEKRSISSKPSRKLGNKYRDLIASSSLSAHEKDAANQALDQVIQDVHDGKITGFRMKIRDIHAEAFGGQDGGRKTQIEKQGFTIIRLHGHPMKKDILKSPVENIQNVKHSAIYPTKIIEELILLLCPEDGIVFDPYMGSGTSALASIRRRRRYIGIDIDPDYCEIANQRLAEYKKEQQKR